MRTVIIVLCCLTTLSACSYSGTNVRPLVSWTGLVPLQKLNRDSGWSIDANARVYLVAPLRLDDRTFANEMTEVFQRYYPRSRLSQYPESLEQAFVSARYAGMDYVVYPRISALMAQQSLGAVIREEVELEEFRLGEANVDIYIYASQGEELVDHVTIDTRGSVFTSESRALLWPPLDEYLRAVSQYTLNHR